MKSTRNYSFLECNIICKLFKKTMGYSDHIRNIRFPLTFTRLSRKDACCIRRKPYHHIFILIFLIFAKYPSRSSGNGSGNGVASSTAAFHCGIFLSLEQNTVVSDSSSLDKTFYLFVFPAKD